MMKIIRYIFFYFVILLTINGNVIAGDELMPDVETPPDRTGGDTH